MAFTEFCCRSGGSNLNAGTRTGNSTEPGTSADFTYATGSWVSSTRTFTAAATIDASIAAGDFVSIYDGSPALTGYVARITSVTGTTIVTSATAFAGTKPGDIVGTATAKIGGAWKGPNAAEAFPFTFIANTLTNATGSFPRVNLKNDASYLITSAISHANTQTRFEGYTTSYGDGGRAILDAQANAIVPLTISGTSCFLGGVISTNNGASGSNAGIVISSTDGYAWNCVAHAIRGHGISLTGSACVAEECEAYDCNKSGTSGLAGINLSANVVCIRCISHDNTGATTDGFAAANGAMLISCIADTNGRTGIRATQNHTIVQCDCYANVGDGINIGAGAQWTSIITNTNLVSNGAWGINCAGGFGNWFNNGFNNNSNGTTTFGIFPINEIGSVSLGAVPYVDAPNGDFRVNLAAAINAGRGTFTQTAASYTGTIGYPDIGAAQHLESAVGGGTGIYRPINGGLII